jgi:nicotinate-nucleotide adenylyltransferase
MARVGILGGTFDPPHNAHIIMAETALRVVPLARVLFMPSPDPPLKSGTGVTPYRERLEMVRLAIDGRSGLELSLLEEFRTGPSFTVDLVRHYRAVLGDEPLLILGADSVCDLPRWREPETILSLATLIVFPRTGYSTHVPVKGNASVILFESPVIDISSTDIRERVRSGRTVESLVPASVLEFVLDKGLYT